MRKHSNDVARFVLFTKADVCGGGWFVLVVVWINATTPLLLSNRFGATCRGTKGGAKQLKGETKTRFI